jgi:hypothetical protein
MKEKSGGAIAGSRGVSSGQWWAVVGSDGRGGQWWSSVEGSVWCNGGGRWRYLCEQRGSDVNKDDDVDRETEKTL